MEDANKISTYEQVMEVWDGNAVLIRSEVTGDGSLVVYVYPHLPRGVSYYGFSLHHEACLGTFPSVPHAVLWARGRGYETTEIL